MRALLVVVVVSLALPSLRTPAPTARADGRLEPGRPRRTRREAHSLIGTFDISKMFKKKYPNKSDKVSSPSASPLRSGGAAALPSPVPPAVSTWTTTDTVTNIGPFKSTDTQFPTTNIERLLLNTTSLEIQTTTNKLSNSQTTFSPLFPTNSGKSKLGIKKKTRKSKSATKPPARSSHRNETTVSPGQNGQSGGGVWPVKHAAPGTQSMTHAGGAAKRDDEGVTWLVKHAAPGTQSMTQAGGAAKRDDEGVTWPVKHAAPGTQSTTHAGGATGRDDMSVTWPVKHTATGTRPATQYAGGAAGRDGTSITWPVKHAAVVEGDIVLGGLMMVHSRSEVATCGRVMSQGGVQALEAMLFALGHAQRVAPPGVRLGVHVLDDCDNDTYGLEMALDFIKGSISNIDDAEYSCNASLVRKVISGVVGAASSVTSVQVANLLRLFKIPQVSFFSTSPELSNKARFEYFTRTIPSDLHQVRAMVEIVKRLGWSYVSIIYEESNYGIKAFEELETMLARNDICIAVKERLVKDSGEADEQAYDALVKRLLARPRARGVIVFGSDQEVAGVMAAVTRLNATDAFSWVGSDGWSARALVSAGRERAVEGTISVQPQANPVRGFREYFLNLTVDNNRRNPWFVEYWEEQFRCRYPGSAATPYNSEYERACTGRERLADANVEFEAQLQFVADAVLAFAYAIRDMHRELCGGTPGLCEKMKPASGATLLKYLRNVRFVGLSGDEFHFDSNGDGPIRYNILHFKQVSAGVFRWVKVGRYVQGALRLELPLLQWRVGAPTPPPSACSEPCAQGQAKQYVEGESCCWHCFNCTQYEIRSPQTETACEECPSGTLPDAARARCAPLPALHMRPDAPPAIAAMAFAAVGILATLFVMGVWCARGDTPVVRASGRELSFVLLSGILVCYLLTFALVLRPTDALCALQRFGTGVCFTVVYAALLTKTNRIARIFAASRRSARRPSLISPKSQLVICSILIAIQVAVLCVWQAAMPARAVRHFPARTQQLLVCDSHVGAALAGALAYPSALVAVCTVYAVLTRKIPEAFNESKHIGFTMYTTCVIWLAFVPLYFGTASHVPLRVTSMAVTISLSASVTLVCLFSPKLYIILVRPERNVRASMMPGKWRGGAAEGCAAGGAVRAALCGSAAIAPPAPAPKHSPRTPHTPADPTPSTDRSTLPDIDRPSAADRQVQTDELALYPRLGEWLGERLSERLSERLGERPDALWLDARRLRSGCAGAGTGSGLPPFSVSAPPPAPTGNGIARRRRIPKITAIGAEISL